MKIRVLLADDHAIVRAGFRQILESTDTIVVVAEAGDGEQAKALIKSEHPHVAVLDIQMPKATGIQVTQWVRQNGLNVGVLILTAYDDDPYVLAVLKAGANGYILKTAQPEDIILAVQEVYEGQSVLDPHITGAVLSHIRGGTNPSRMERLTDREMEVLQFVAKGLTNKAVGVQLGISDRTVQGHLSHIFNKLDVDSRTEAVMRAISYGWISQEAGKA